MKYIKGQNREQTYLFPPAPDLHSEPLFFVARSTVSLLYHTSSNPSKVLYFCLVKSTNRASVSPWTKWTKIPR